jgi:AraC-like DNA-binding protein
MYRELPPPFHLSKFTACLWFQTVADEPYVHRVLPDACSDIVSVAGGAPIVVGPATGAVLVTLPAHALIVGARFRPGMAAAAFGVPADDLLDRETPLEDVWSRRAAEELRERVGVAGTIEHKLAAFERVLSVRLSKVSNDELVTSAVAWLARHPERHVGELSTSLGMGSRQILRRFRAAVGYGPKTLHRVLRFQRLLVAAHRRGIRSMAGLAAEAGYLDQPHMTREVADLAGVTPGLLLPGSFAPAAMSDFFNTVDRA